jgi:hypothetical protein
MTTESNFRFRCYRTPSYCGLALAAENVAGVTVLRPNTVESVLGGLAEISRPPITDWTAASLRRNVVCSDDKAVHKRLAFERTKTRTEKPYGTRLGMLFLTPWRSRDEGRLKLCSKCVLQSGIGKGTSNDGHRSVIR